MSDAGHDQVGCGVCGDEAGHDGTCSIARCSSRIATLTDDLEAARLATQQAHADADRLRADLERVTRDRNHFAARAEQLAQHRNSLQLRLDVGFNDDGTVNVHGLRADRAEAERLLMDDAWPLIAGVDPDTLLTVTGTGTSPVRRIAAYLVRRKAKP